MKELKKISLIEAPREEEVSREELEEALGGWNCGSYDPSVCKDYGSGICTEKPGSKDYCGTYSQVL